MGIIAESIANHQGTRHLHQPCRIVNRRLGLRPGYVNSCLVLQISQGVQKLSIKGRISCLQLRLHGVIQFGYRVCSVGYRKISVVLIQVELQCPKVSERLFESCGKVQPLLCVCKRNLIGGQGYKYAEC